MSEEPNFNLIPLLEERIPLVGDGGAETLLRNFGLEENCPPILANLEQPDLVKRMHHAFIRRGSRLIRTNSSFSQADEVLVNRLEACINSASALAREVSNKRSVIAGRITCAPSDWGRDARFQFYGEQAVYLSDTWVDLIWLEQFSEYEELKLALRAVRQVSVIQTVAHLSLKKDKQSLEILDQLKELMSLGATFVGLMIDSEKSMNRDQLQDLIDELGILSLILDLDLEKETFSRISDSIHQIVPPETALICGGKSFLPEHIPHFSKINADQHQ